jgi:two-component system, response regulator YesN
MKVNVKKNELLYKYLTSYLCILFVPIIVIWFFTYNHYADILEREVVTGDINRLSQIQNIYDDHIERVYQILSQMSNNSVINSVIRNPEDKLNVMSASKELANFVAYDSFIYEISVFLQDNKSVLTSSSEYDIDKYINYFYKYDDWTEEDIKNILRSNSSQYIRASETISLGGTNQYKNIITYSFSYPINSIYPLARVMVLVDQQSVNRLMSSHFPKKDESIMLLDSEKRIIATTSDEPYIKSAELLSYIDSIQNNLQNGSTELKIGKGKYLLSYVQSPDTMWMYVKIVPYSVVMESVDKIKKDIIIFLFITFLIGMILIINFIKINYNPIKELKKLIMSNSNELPENLNELETVKYIISDLNSVNTNLNNQIIKSIPAVKDFILLSILKGQISNVDALNEIMGIAGMQIRNQNYSVAFLYFHSNTAESIISNENLKEKIERFSCEGFQVFCKESFDCNVLVSFITIRKGELHELKQRLMEIHQSIEAMNIRCTISVGNIYPSIKDSGRAFIEASSALEYRFIKASSSIIFISDISTNDRDFIVNKRKFIEKMKAAIKLGNYDNIADTIDSILDNIKHSDIPLTNARLLCYEIADTVFNEYQNILPDSSSQNLLLDTISIINRETIDEFKETLKYFISNMLKSKPSEEDSKYSRMMEIIAYIKKNCCSCDFSIQNMADYFEMSPSHLSHYFKDNTGQNITQYITYYKIEIVQSILRDSDENLKQIVEKVGFFDVSSFARKFKQVTGVTPTQYRQLYEKKD